MMPAAAVPIKPRRDSREREPVSPLTMGDVRWRGVVLPIVAIAALLLLLAPAVVERASVSRAPPGGAGSATTSGLPAEDAVPHGAGHAAARRPEGKLTAVRIEVVDATTALPVPHATVEARRGVDLAGSGVTDSLGFASLSLDLSEGVSLLACRRGYLPAPYWLDDVEDAPWISLQPGLPFTGRVLHADGKAAVRAEVDVEFVLNAHLPLRPDAQGCFEIPGLPVGEKVKVRAREDGYWPEEVEFTVDPANTLVEIVLGRGSACEGVVVDDEHRPVAGALVTVRNEDRGFEHAESRTDGEGRFTIRGLPPDHGLVQYCEPPPWPVVESYRARAVTPERSAGESGKFAGDPDAPPHRCEIVVRPCAYVVLTVSYPDGSPVTQAGWRFGDHGNSGSERGAPGQYISGPVPPGPLEILVYSVPGWNRQKLVVDVRPNIRNDVALRLDARSVLAGTVVDKEGRPVRRVQAQFGEAWMLTGDDGAFRLHGLGAEPGTLEIDGFGYLLLSLVARPGEPPLRLVLDRAPRAVGRLDPPSQAMGASYGSDGETGGRYVRVGRDGSFEVRSLPAGREFWLKLEMEGSAPSVFTGLRLEADETLDLGVLKPHERVTLRGVVTDPRGRPLTGVDVIAEAEIEDLQESGGASTDDEGSFVIAGLADTALTVCASRGGYAPSTVRVERPSAAPRLTIVIEPGGVLEILATPWDNVAVEVEAVDGRTSDTVYTSQGDSRFLALRPGWYRVSDRLGDRTVEVRVGETRRVDLGE